MHLIRSASTQGSRTLRTGTATEGQSKLSPPSRTAATCSDPLCHEFPRRTPSAACPDAAAAGGATPVSASGPPAPAPAAARPREPSDPRRGREGGGGADASCLCRKEERKEMGEGHGERARDRGREGGGGALASVSKEPCTRSEKTVFLWGQSESSISDRAIQHDISSLSVWLQYFYPLS